MGPRAKRVIECVAYHRRTLMKQTKSWAGPNGKRRKEGGEGDSRQKRGERYIYIKRRIPRSSWFVKEIAPVMVIRNKVGRIDPTSPYFVAPPKRMQARGSKAPKNKKKAGGKEKKRIREKKERTYGKCMSDRGPFAPPDDLPFSSFLCHRCFLRGAQQPRQEKP